MITLASRTHDGRVSTPMPILADAPLRRRLGPVTGVWDRSEVRGTPKVGKPAELRRPAVSPDAFAAGVFVPPEGTAWDAPAGADTRCGGPS